MSYTEVTEEGCFTKIKNAIGGVVVGFIMLVISFPLLFWNEGKAVRRAQALDFGKNNVVSIEAGSVDQANEGKLVHITNEAVTDNVVSDSTFGVSMKALRLRRNVEMYQWKEKSKTRKRGKKKITEYTYSKVWSKTRINSSGFKQSGHTNPSSMPYSNKKWQAGKVTVGAFTLSKSLVDDINDWTDLPPSEAKNKPSRATIDGSYLFIGSGSLATPRIGDVRVSFEAVKPCVVSFYSKQKGNTFTPYKMENGESLQRLAVGSKTAEELFAAAEFEETIRMWVFRFLGFFFMWLGIVLILNPIKAIADVIPLIGGFMGNMVGAGISLAAFGVAAPLTFMTIAIGWIFYRPVVGILLMMVGGAIFVGIYKLASGKKAAAGPAKAATPPPVPPPVPEG